MRLDKYLAQSSIGTRKKVHKIIKEGQVTINGVMTLDATLQIDEKQDVITCRGEQVLFMGSVCYMFNKPKGCISARKGDSTPTVLSYFNGIETEGLFIVGRLDKDTEGLLLLTNDGALDSKLMNPDNHIEKTYFFWAIGQISQREQDRLEKSMMIDGNGRKARRCKPAGLKLLKQGMYSE